VHSSYTPTGMGLYNSVFGCHPLALKYLALLGLKHENFGRFRDAYPQTGAVVIYTRVGGGNRDDYPQVFEMAKNHPLFLEAVDDEFDRTYCSFRFRFPERGRDPLPGEFLECLPSPLGGNLDVAWRVVHHMRASVPSEPPSDVKWKRVLDSAKMKMPTKRTKNS